MADVLAGTTATAAVGACGGSTWRGDLDPDFEMCLGQLGADEVLWLERTLAELGADGVTKRRAVICWLSKTLRTRDADYLDELVSGAGLDQLVRLTSARDRAPMPSAFLVAAGRRLIDDDVLRIGPEPYGVEALLYNIAHSDPGAGRELLGRDDFSRWLLGHERGRHGDHGTRALRNRSRAS